MFSLVSDALFSKAQKLLMAKLALLPLHHTTAEGALLLALANAAGWGAGRGFVRDSVGGFAAAANIVEPDPKLA